MSEPKKHHFVHISYQKRFLATEKEVYVLTKEFNNNIKLKTPSQICYEMHLHTLKYNRQNYLEIEKFYSSIEGEISKLLKIIDEGDNEYKFLWEESLKIPATQLILKSFISLMFWRNPCQTELAKEYSVKLLKLYDEADKKVKDILPDRKTIKYLQKNRKRENILKIIQFILLPLITFRVFDKDKIISIARVTKSGLIITCDNPVVYKSNVENLFNFEDFYLPLDKSKILTNNKNFSDKKVTAVDINLDIAKNSKKYIIGATKEILEYVKLKI